MAVSAIAMSLALVGAGQLMIIQAGVSVHHRHHASLDRSGVACGRALPSAYLELIDRLAAICRLMANELDHQRLPTTAKDKLCALVVDSSQLELSDSPDAVVILAQMLSILVDLLELAGMDYLKVREPMSIE